MVGDYPGNQVPHLKIRVRAEQNSRYGVRETVRPAQPRRIATTQTPNVPNIQQWLGRYLASGRKLWIGATLSLLLIPIASAAHRKTPPSAPHDPGYVQALAAANRFMYAWQAGELGNGMALLSDGIRHAQTAGEIERFFSAEADRAFEIGKGSGNRGRYSFPVVLVSLKASPGSDPSAEAKLVSRRPSNIVLVKTGKNDWVVDKLP